MSGLIWSLIVFAVFFFFGLALFVIALILILHKVYLLKESLRSHRESLLALARWLSEELRGFSEEFAVSPEEVLKEPHKIRQRLRESVRFQQTSDVQKIYEHLATIQDLNYYVRDIEKRYQKLTKHFLVRFLIGITEGKEKENVEL